MRISGDVAVPRTFSALIERPQPRPLAWPLAVALIVGLSAGLWALIYQGVRLLLSL